MGTTNLVITGTPVLSIPFDGVPSINYFHGKHWRAQRVITAEWRYEAKVKASTFEHLDRPIIKERALVVVNVYPPYEEKSDIHNVYVKAILDGFSDAGVWVDDEWAWLPAIMWVWGGITPKVPREKPVRRTVIDIYELGTFIMNGEERKLPAGRISL